MYDDMTKEDIQKIQDEIEYRKMVVRPEAIQSVKEARAHGDLSENFEYHAAKQYKNQNESVTFSGLPSPRDRRPRKPGTAPRPGR